MIDLNESAFGKIKVCEILGASPDIKNISNMLECEIASLRKNLKNLSKNELELVKTRQAKIASEINSRPGAMALPQNKISLFTECNTRYIEFIEEEINLKE